MGAPPTVVTGEGDAEEKGPAGLEVCNIVNFDDGRSLAKKKAKEAKE